MILAFAIGVAMLSAADAQVNIEKYRGRPGVTGKVDVQFGGAAGNSEFFDGGATANVTLNTTDYTLLLVGRGLLGFASGERFDNQGLAHLRFTWTRRRRFQPEIFSQSDYARPRRLVARVLFGGGVRSLLATGENVHLSLGNSLMWEREELDLESAARHPDSESVVRSSNYLNLQFDKGVELQMAGYYQFSLRDVADARVLGQLEITSHIVGPLEQTTALRLRVDTDPPDGVEKSDLHVGTSFGLNF